MNLHLIAAMTCDHRVIGYQGKIPWDIKSDLKRFQNTTMGHPCIMGASTFFGIVKDLGWPLPGRTSIVLTKNREQKVLEEGGVVAHSPEAALAIAERFDNDPFIIGGEQIYKRMLPLARVLHVTTVYPDQPIEGDSHFPDVNLTTLQPLEWATKQLWDPADQYRTSFGIYVR